MYKKILVTLDRSDTDRAILEHLKPLAQLMRSRVVFLHVLTSAPAKYHGSAVAGKEIEDCQAYLAQATQEFAALGLEVEAELAFGDPVKEIVTWVQSHGCDLVAMGTHGHHFMADLVLGTTAIRVQHALSVPVLMLRAR